MINLGTKLLRTSMFKEFMGRREQEVKVVWCLTRERKSFKEATIMSIRYYREGKNNKALDCMEHVVLRSKEYLKK